RRIRRNGQQALGRGVRPDAWAGSTASNRLGGEELNQKGNDRRIHKMSLTWSNEVCVSTISPICPVVFVVVRLCRRMATSELASINARRAPATNILHAYVNVPPSLSQAVTHDRLVALTGQRW